MKLVRTILQKFFVLHLLSSDKLMAQSHIGSFSLKPQLPIYLLAQTANMENGIWLESSAFLIPEEKLYPSDGNFDECISLCAQIQKT